MSADPHDHVEADMYAVIKAELEAARGQERLHGAIDRADELFAAGSTPEFVIKKLREQAATLAGPGTHPLIRAGSIALSDVAAVIETAYQAINVGRVIAIAADHLSGPYVEAITSLPSETSRVDTEFSIEWARNNPDLFAAKYNKFFQSFRDGWEISSHARPGFLTLIAKRSA
ncbi:hypothetical protein ACN8ZM_41170 (plasmid) [Burkholderia aenigmatica]|uniref:hypothetical protein n=1 Tax=Burkholderia aenigmatica TaxID=2015348 RepID=UPI0039085C44